MRRRCGATFLPPCRRSTASERVTFQRQRISNIGASSSACTRISSTVCDDRNWNTVSSGKLCGCPSEITMPSSVAAACSSKSKLRQKRLRSARPQARLMRPPSGEWMTSCMPPPSSKKRSAIRRLVVGSAPSAERAAPRYATSCSAAVRDMHASSWILAAISPCVCPSSIIVSTCRRTAPTSSDSSLVRAGASPNQNGIVGGGPARVLDQHACRSRPGGSATPCCRAGRRRRPRCRWRSARRPRRRAPPPDTAPPGSWRSPGWRHPT